MFIDKDILHYPATWGTE